MKKLLYWATTVAIGGMLFSCKGNKPDEPQALNAEKMLEMSLAYFPYNETDILVFCNEETCQEWEIETYNIYKTYKTGKEDTESQGISKSLVDVKFTIKNKTFTKQKDANIVFNITKDTLNISKDTCFFISQFVYLPLSESEIYYGETRINCTEIDFYSYFPDTITVPLTEDMNNRSTPLPEGSCAHIVKNQGLIDFCVDGATLWKRVK